ncbi:MAG: hypothetical protein FWC92_04575, partial [Defluviitaleaceae bacterium]|nr:hypothetical protein [Defluviitaleaceae bacterium]
LHSTQARINNAVTLKKISSIVDSKDTPDLTNELFYRFADLVDAINDPSLLFIIIHSLEQHYGVNVGKYGGFGKEDSKRGKISSENVFVKQFITLYEKTISAINKKG